MPANLHAGENFRCLYILQWQSTKVKDSHSTKLVCIFHNPYFHTVSFILQYLELHQEVVWIF